MDFITPLNDAFRITLISVTVFIFSYLVLGGIEWSRSGGDSGKTTRARNKIVTGIINLFFLAISFAIYLFVQNFIDAETSMQADLWDIQLALASLGIATGIIAGRYAGFPAENVIKWLKNRTLTLEDTRTYSVAGAYLVKRGIAVSKTLGIVLFGWGLIVVGILTDYVAHSLLVPVSTIFIVLIVLTISDFALLWYRLNKGYYGNNVYETREMLRFVLENSDDSDFPHDSGLKDFVPNSTVNVNAEQTSKVGATS